MPDVAETMFINFKTIFLHIVNVVEGSLAKGPKISGDPTTMWTNVDRKK